MSIALTQQVKEMEQKLLELADRVKQLESAYNPSEDPIQPLKRRGRQPKNENE